jgi:spermidine synthase
VVFTATTPYQRIVVTSGRGGHRLFLNGNLQFAERDEYRYHEALVHPVMSAHGAPKKIAVLGGGDGMAVREVLKYPGVESVTLVELDPAMTNLFSQQPALKRLNGDALLSPKVHVVNADAFQWLDKSADMFDVIVVDFPDPTNFSIGKLYTNSFYALLDRHLSASGYAVIQTTSPLVARRSFWTVVSHAGGRGPEGRALPRQCAQLRRMGLCGRQPPAFQPRNANGRPAARPALPGPANPAAAV